MQLKYKDTPKNLTQAKEQELTAELLSLKLRMVATAHPPAAPSAVQRNTLSPPFVGRPRKTHKKSPHKLIKHQGTAPTPHHVPTFLKQASSSAAPPTRLLTPQPPHLGPAAAFTPTFKLATALAR